MKISVRESTKEDAAAIFQLRSDKRIRGMNYPPAMWETPQLFSDLIAAVAKATDPKLKFWTIWADDQFAGHVNEFFSQGIAGRNSTLGWNIVPELWGKGIAPEAVRTVFDLRLEDSRFEAVIAFCFESNARCRRVMEKLGFEQTAPTWRESFANFCQVWGRQRLLKFTLTREQWSVLKLETSIATNEESETSLESPSASRRIEK